MADLTTMRAHLAQISGQLVQMSVFTTGRPDGVDKANQEAAKLERFAETVRLMIRDLNSAESLIRLRESELRTIPRDRRFSAEQSLKQLGENVRGLKQEVEALAGLIKDLLDRNGLMNPGQKAKALIDLVNDLARNAGPDVQAQIGHMMPSSIGPVPHTAISLTGVFPAIVFAWLAMKLVAQRRKTGN